MVYKPFRLPSPKTAPLDFKPLLKPLEEWRPEDSDKIAAMRQVFYENLLTEEPSLSQIESFEEYFVLLDKLIKFLREKDTALPPLRTAHFAVPSVCRDQLEGHLFARHKNRPGRENRKACKPDQRHFVRAESAESRFYQSSS